MTRKEIKQSGPKASGRQLSAPPSLKKNHAPKSKQTNKKTTGKKLSNYSFGVQQQFKFKEMEIEISYCL